MLRSALFVSLLAFSATAAAQGFGYSYIQGSYGSVEVDTGGGNVDGDGFGISGSFEFTKEFFFAGEYQTADMDFGVDLNILELAVGYHTGISEQLDFTAQVGFVNTELDAGIGGSVDDDGLMLGVGLRGALSDAIELNGGIDYVDFDLGGGETRITAGFRYALTEELTVGAEAGLWDDIDVYQLNLRFDFE